MLLRPKLENYHMSPTPLTKYLQTRAMQGPWRIAGCTETGFSGAVVIPALAESAHLFATLRSLAANPPELLARFLVLVVVNHSEDGLQSDKEDNYETLQRLAVISPEFAPLRLAWVDVASPGLEMPAKEGGVGLARKIGLDLALSRLDFSGQNPILVCLDADTLVEPSYLPAIDRHFRHTGCGGAIIPFRHRPAASPEQQLAIDRYELFLRSYVLGLALAGSPYAFHTVGSAMVCTASAYIRMGGMNRRQAAEDFYFLQQLHRTAGVEQLRGTLVHPSPRPSHRVPFGTGRSVSGALREDAGAIMFYRPECFRILGGWLKTAIECPDRNAAVLLAEAAAVSPHLAVYLENAGFTNVWEGLRKNNRETEALCSAFHGWFDGLKTMKLIHYLSAAAFPRCEPVETLPLLLEWAGLEKVTGVAEQLTLLRKIQNR
jgi:glycosyltransferase involved in cell wall biosynthesis